MRILKEDVLFDEILQRYEAENRDWKGYAIGLEYLTAANRRCQDRWTLVLLSGADISSVMLPSHNHPIEVIPPSGLSVSEAVQRLKQLPKDLVPDCWERICGIKERDFSKMHIALEIENGILKHVDGVHRLLAYMLFEKNQEVPAYVAGAMPASR
jgi:Family of unknown function (DUF6309)